MVKADLAKWIDEGRSLEDIARLTGKHPSTVGYWVAKHGLRAAHRDRHAARGGLDRETLAALVARDLTVREIAAEVQRSTATVRTGFSATGFRRPPRHGVGPYEDRSRRDSSLIAFATGPPSSSCATTAAPHACGAARNA